MDTKLCSCAHCFSSTNPLKGHIWTSEQNWRQLGGNEWKLFFHVQVSEDFIQEAAAAWNKVTRHFICIISWNISTIVEDAWNLICVISHDIVRYVTRSRPEMSSTSIHPNMLATIYFRNKLLETKSQQKLLKLPSFFRVRFRRNKKSFSLDQSVCSGN